MRTVTGLKDGDRVVALQTLNPMYGDRIPAGTELEVLRLGDPRFGNVWVRLPGSKWDFCCPLDFLELAGGQA